MARTALTGAMNVVKYALMTHEELLQTNLSVGHYRRCKKLLSQARTGSWEHKALVILAGTSRDSVLRARATSLLESRQFAEN